MKRLLVILSCMLLTGCTSMFCSPEIIKVPVMMQWPEPPVTVRPDLPLDNISAEVNSKSYDQVNKDLQITIEKLQNYSQQLEIYLDVYRTKQVPK